MLKSYRAIISVYISEEEQYVKKVQVLWSHYLRAEWLTAFLDYSISTGQIR